MRIKQKLAWIRKAAETGADFDPKPRLSELLGWTMHFLVGAVLALVPLQGGFAPFGIAAAAQGGWSVGSLLCGLGASIGYLAAFGAENGAEPAAAIVLLLCTAYVCRESKSAGRVYFAPAVAGAATLLTGLPGVYTAEAVQGTVLPLFARTVLAFGGTYFFREAFSSTERLTEAAETRHSISLILLLSCVMMALSRLTLGGGISLGRVFAVLLVQIFALRGGAVSGAAAGVILGLSMDAASDAAAFYTASYAFCGLIAGAFYRHGRFPFLASYILSAALSMICGSAGGLRVELGIETLAASLLFLAVPNRLVIRLGSVLKRSAVSGSESGLRRYTAGRLRRMGEAFADLYATVDGQLATTGGEEDISKVFDRASEQVCAHCRSKTACWNGNYSDTLNAFNDAGARIRSRGSMLTEDLPQHFADRCGSVEKLTAAVNGELRGAMYRRQFSARLAENRRAAYGQYADISEILSGISEELDNAYGPDPLTQRRLSRYLEAQDLEGDVTAFRDRIGRLHITVESPKLKHLLRSPGYLDRLSDAVGVRLCRPIGSDAQAEGRITLMEAEPLCAAVGVASMKKSGESVSGDRGTYFKTDQGMLCILLSNGMGSGENAARESVAAVRILERFLRTGVEPVRAMKILNSLMLLKNEGAWGFATVDLLCVDLFSGDAMFYKYGAAPSFVKAGKQIRRIRSESLAAGLSCGEESLPDCVRIRLHPGNVALISSDGVLAETDDAWVRKMLVEQDTADMKALAKDVLQTALKQYGAGDDMTVLAVRIEKRA